MTIYIKVPVTEGLPASPGKYIVFTESTYGKHFKSYNQFAANFNGKHFEVNNQIVTDWLKEVDFKEI